MVSRFSFFFSFFSFFPLSLHLIFHLQFSLDDIEFGILYQNSKTYFSDRPAVPFRQSGSLFLSPFFLSPLLLSSLLLLYFQLISTTLSLSLSLSSDPRFSFYQIFKRETTDYRPLFALHRCCKGGFPLMVFSENIDCELDMAGFSLSLFSLSLLSLFSLPFLSSLSLSSLSLLSLSSLSYFFTVEECLFTRIRIECDDTRAEVFSLFSLSLFFFFSFLFSLLSLSACLFSNLKIQKGEIPIPRKSSP